MDNAEALGEFDPSTLVADSMTHRFLGTFNVSPFFCYRGTYVFLMFSFLINLCFNVLLHSVPELGLREIYIEGVHGMEYTLRDLGLRRSQEVFGGCVTEVGHPLDVYDECVPVEVSNALGIPRDQIREYPLYRYVIFCVLFN